MTSSYKTLLSAAFRRSWGQTKTELNGTANRNPHFQPTPTWRYVTDGRRGGGWERLCESWQGLGPICFTFLSTPPCLLAGVCVQMGTSVSHSSSPNWHLTAAPHGLLTGCVSARFSQRRKQQRRIKHHPAERALSPAPFTPFTPPPRPVLHSLPSPRSYAREAVCTPDSPKRSLSLFSVSLSLWNPPLLPPPPYPLPTSTFSPGSSPTEEQHEEDIRILKMFCIQALSQKRWCIRQTYGRIFKILSLFNQTHQSWANFLFCAGGWAKATFEDRCWKKIRIFLFSINIKVIIVIHRSNLNWKKMHHILCKGYVQTHQGMWMSYYTKWGKMKQSKALKVPRLQETNGQRSELGSVFLQTSGAIFNANWLVCCSSVILRSSRMISYFPKRWNYFRNRWNNLKM